MLNKNLIKSQGLSDDDVLELVRLHEVREKLFDSMDKLDPIKDNDSLRLYAKLLESLEYNMQRVWKFEQNPEFHTWWFKVPHCTCPKMDNADPIYIHRLYHAGCPIHGFTTQD